MIRQYFKDNALALGIEYNNDMSLNDLKRSVSNKIRNISNSEKKDLEKLNLLVELRKNINKYLKGLEVDEVENYELELFSKTEDTTNKSKESSGKWDDFIEFVRDDKSSFLLMPKYNDKGVQEKASVPADLTNPGLGSVDIFYYYLCERNTLDNKLIVFIGMKQEDMIEFIDNDVDELNYFKNVFMSKSRIKDVLSTEYDNLDAKHRYFGTIVKSQEGYESIVEDSVVTMLSGQEFINGINYFCAVRSHSSFFGIKPVIKDGNQRSSIIRSDGGILKRLYTYEIVDKDYKNGARQYAIIELNAVQLFNLMVASTKKNKFCSNYMNLNDFDSIFSYNPENPNALFGYPGDLEKSLNCSQKNFLRQIDQRIVDELKLQKLTEVKAFASRLELEAESKKNN